MKHLLLPLVLLALPATAQAACFAGYKAKQDNPLRLHYGVMQIDACDPQEAEREVSERLQGSGWTLLNVVQVSAEAPTDQQKANAGDYFLRY
ncbi:hypothetical protein [Aestuariicoccus sp. MJ-SS9]|uniref:hypothetical protein n=1 Tax=Aestuariicoccus sp. MJ-SS9 TaxID=3079855 RepID=UPI00290C6B4E|nr:hypothetical protein [Aestuariicoccus sp. MJ-SS9]MDU8911401.1 hypothetical protein [Aestuariicoccus sp. MJ-SS9]